MACRHFIYSYFLRWHRAYVIIWAPMCPLSQPRTPEKPMPYAVPHERHATRATSGRQQDGATRLGTCRPGLGRLVAPVHHRCTLSGSAPVTPELARRTPCRTGRARQARGALLRGPTVLRLSVSYLRSINDEGLRTAGCLACVWKTRTKDSACPPCHTQAPGLRAQRSAACLQPSKWRWGVRPC